MATSPTSIQNETTTSQPRPDAAQAPLLISLSSLAPESFEHVLANLAEAFPGADLLVATPDRDGSGEQHPSGLKLIGYNPAAPSAGAFTLTAADFLNAHELARQHNARTILLLGAECQSLAPQALHALAAAVVDEAADLVLPHYDMPARAGLVNSAILYPVTRALFGARPRFPLAIDLGLSARMAERLATAAQKFTAANQLDALIWPVSEAAVANFKIVEVEAGTRTAPQPTAPDLNTLLASVASSLFADVDAKAAFWQRARVTLPGTIPASTSEASFTQDDVEPMIDSFRLAYGNLHEIWSLVLPPQSLLGLKRLSLLSPASFRMPDSLWARIVFDFLLAYRLRTINRGHLLGAMTPLYLAWVASHILLAHAGEDPERHIDSVAAAFEADKAYLVSRWRWPDRFNP